MITVIWAASLFKKKLTTTRATTTQILSFCSGEGRVSERIGSKIRKKNEKNLLGGGSAGRTASTADLYWLPKKSILLSR